MIRVKKVSVTLLSMFGIKRPITGGRVEVQATSAQGPKEPALLTRRVGGEDGLS